ncbi:MAG: ABC-type transport system [Microbacterium sp.]|nr:ABC-type transport system [Microbacterium sp.]
MNPRRLGTVIGIELRQRVRSVGWYVLLGVFFVILVGVLVLSFASFALGGGGNEWFFGSRGSPSSSWRRRSSWSPRRPAD